MENVAEMKKYLIEQYTRLAYTKTYAICVKAHGRMTAVIINDLDPMFEEITYCERNAESHGGCYGLRLDKHTATMDLLLSIANEKIDLGTYKEFEKGYNEYKANGNKGNRGDYFEDVFVELVHGTKPEKRNACFRKCGDVIANNIHYQCKFYNATFTTEKTIACQIAC